MDITFLKFFLIYNVGVFLLFTFFFVKTIRKLQHYKLSLLINKMNKQVMAFVSNTIAFDFLVFLYYLIYHT